MELGHQRKRVVRISTGSKQFDAILGGWVKLLILSLKLSDIVFLLFEQWIPKHEYQ